MDRKTKGLFTFTGNPIIDNGIAVLSLISKKEKFEEITPEAIENNIDSFFEFIKYQYNDENATKAEQKHSKKKLKQHLTSLFTTNHYLHGINNYLCSGYNITISSKDCLKISKRLPDQIENYQVTKSEIKKNKFDVKLTSTRQIKETSKEAIQNLISEFTVGITCKYKTKALVKKKVKTNEDYFISFKDEVLQILEGKSKILHDINRANKNNLCNFCGKRSDIILSKDIFPLTSALGDFNLGTVYSCRFCYLATIFSFFNFINLKKDEKSSGIYFFYHFSAPETMLEHAKQQFNHLSSEKLASLPTKVGGKFSSVFDDLYNKVRSLESVIILKPSATLYFLLNDNRGAIYENLILPSGLFQFWLFLNSPEYSGEWSKLHRNINNAEDYSRFIEGRLSIRKFKENKKEVLIEYLKEVVLMNKELIEVCERLSQSLIDYFKAQYENRPKRDNWIEEFYDFFDFKKPYKLFNNLFSMNKDFFCWKEGKNLITVSDSKLLLEEYKSYNLLFGLIEYFILNSFNEDEKKKYFDYNNSKKNK